MTLIGDVLTHNADALASSVTVPEMVEMVTVAEPAKRFVPRCSARAAASECCWMEHHTRDHQGHDLKNYN